MFDVPQEIPRRTSIVIDSHTWSNPAPAVSATVGVDIVVQACCWGAAEFHADGRDAPQAIAKVHGVAEFPPLSTRANGSSGAPSSITSHRSADPIVKYRNMTAIQTAAIVDIVS